MSVMSVHKCEHVCMCAYNPQLDKLPSMEALGLFLLLPPHLTWPYAHFTEQRSPCQDTRAPRQAHTCGSGCGGSSSTRA